MALPRKIILAAALLGALLVSPASAALAGTGHAGSRAGCRTAAHVTFKVLARHRTAESATRTEEIRVTRPGCAAPSAPGRARLRRAGGGSPQDGFKCTLTAEIHKSARFPGYMQSVAYVHDCTGVPVPPSDCSQAADMRLFYRGEWHPDGDGPTRYGCEGEPSILTKYCQSYPESLGYDTVGIFTITWEGELYGPYDVYSGEITAIRLC
jgi:hypothetical protein